MTIPLITYGVQTRYKGAKPTIPWVDTGCSYRSAAVAIATRKALENLEQNAGADFRAVKMSTVTEIEVIDG